MQPPPNMKTAAPRAAPLQPAGGRTFYKDIIIERIFPFVQMKIYQNGKTGNERKKGREMAEGVGKFTELIPVLLQEEVSDIAVLNPIPAHVKLVQCDHILGEVVAHPVIDSKLAGYGIF